MFFSVSCPATHKSYFCPLASPPPPPALACVYGGGGGLVYTIGMLPNTGNPPSTGFSQLASILGVWM